MGDHTTRSGPPPGRRRVAGAAAALALAGLPATAAPPRAPAERDSGGPGAIVQHEEARGSNILYLEQSGGLVTRVAAPRVAEGDEPAAKAPGVEGVRPAERASVPAKRRVSKARAVTPGAPGAKP
jgi:hypothetical protein